MFYSVEALCRLRDCGFGSSRSNPKAVGAIIEFGIIPPILTEASWLIYDS